MGIPALSGNYTHFKYLRDNLEDYRFYLLALGNVGSVGIKDNDYINLGGNLDRKINQRELGKIFLDFCEKHEVDLIIPMNSGIVASCIPFLKKAKVVQIVNTDTARVYHYVTSCLEHSSKIICISRRQQEILSKRMPEDVFKDKTTLIPHGVHHQPDLKLKVHQSPLTIGFLGRIHHGHKGVFKIPEILRRLTIPYHFEIVGEGEDKEQLFEQLNRYNIPFTYKGHVTPDQINEVIVDWDILLFPSQLEGFGLTLIEAMNNGVVPVANHLPGITDFIITSGEDGFVVKNNNVQDFVNRIEQLNGDRDLLYQMKLVATDTVRRRFGLSAIIQQYQKVFDEVLKTEKRGKTTGFSEWQPYGEYTPSILTRIGFRLKKLLIRY